jgi:NADPH2:quinone reductase
VIGVSLGTMPSRSAMLRSEMEEIFKLYENGKVKPVIGKSFPLGDAASAHKYIHARKNIGKVILNVK